MPTVQHLISHARLINQLNAKLNATGLVLDREQQGLWDEIIQEGLRLATELHDFGVEFGAGLFPNTFQKDGQYQYVNTAADEVTLLQAGWLPARFPETMIRFGSPDITVHNTVEKFNALQAGYSLPGLTPVILGESPGATGY